MAKILCVLYPDPQAGYPPKYIRDLQPSLKGPYAEELLSLPEKIRPSEAVVKHENEIYEAFLKEQKNQLLGCVSGKLGLEKWCKDNGHELIVVSDKDGKDSDFDKYLPEADVFITQPFWPAYLTKERIQKAKNLKIAITAGIGSDHVDLKAAAEAGISVVEATGSNSISVAEHIVMMALSLVRNYLPAHALARNGVWNIADCVSRSYDLANMRFGAVGSGRIGYAVLKRMKAFGCELHYTQRHRLPEAVEKELGLTFHKTPEEMAPHMDIISAHIPLYPQTRNLFNEAFFAKVNHGTYFINCARGELVDMDALKKAQEEGKIAAYAGDVWFPQPAPADHPWRTMPFNGMTPHMSGTSLSAQARYISITHEMLKNFLAGKPIPEDYYIVKGDQLSGTGAQSYKL
ncbi:NAD-dependent formate dehydrogenase [Acetobacteraceae bacterium]|nr:NAD-dependent formate dehydrogenase [Acetobacteraceae bacterium]